MRLLLSTHFLGFGQSLCSLQFAFPLRFALGNFTLCKCLRGVDKTPLQVIHFVSMCSRPFANLCQPYTAI